jgi:hypothetical protein
MESIHHPHRYIDKVAIDKLNPGDAVVIFTPDSKCLYTRERWQFA